MVRAKHIIAIVVALGVVMWLYVGPNLPGPSALIIAGTVGVVMLIRYVDRRRAEAREFDGSSQPPATAEAETDPVFGGCKGDPIAVNWVVIVIAAPMVIWSLIQMRWIDAAMTLFGAVILHGLPHRPRCAP